MPLLPLRNRQRRSQTPAHSRRKWREIQRKNPPAEPAVGEPDEGKKPEEPKDDGPIHWLQQYQQAALEASRSPMPRSRSNKAATGSPFYSMIEWSGGNLEFANGAFLGSPMPKIYLDGEIAFCAEWNGQHPSGDYVQSGEGSDPAIKQILANYDNSGKSKADYCSHPKTGGFA